MIRSLLRFEFSFHLRQPATIAAGLLLFVLGLTFARLNAGADLEPDAPWLIAYSLGILSLGSVLVAAVLAGPALLRDHDSRMAPLVFATGISHFDYLISRFCGMLGVAAAVYIVAGLGMLLGYVVHGVATFGALGAILRALIMIVLPNVLVSVSVLFAVAALTRSSAAAWIAGAALYMLYFVGSILGDSPLMAHAATRAPGELHAALLLDPYGLIAFLEQTRLWTEAERNLRGVPLAGPLLLNRLLWIALALALFAWVARRFRFRRAALRTPRGRRTPEPPASTQPLPAWRPVAVLTAPLRLLAPAALVHARIALRAPIFRTPLLVLMLLWLGMTAISLIETVARGELGVPMLPTAGLLAPQLHQPLMALGWLVVALFAAEIAWQSRAHGIQPVVQALPAPEVASYLGELLALAVLIATLILAGVACAIGLHLMLGAESLDLSRYLGLLYYAGVPLILFGGLALLIQRAAPNRYVGLLLCVCVPLAVALLNRFSGLGQTILGRSAFPGYVISDLVEQPFHADAFGAMVLLWTGLGLALLIWRFGRGRRFSRPLAIVLALVSLGHGASIHQRLVPMDPSRFHAPSPEWAAARERQWGEYASLSTPSTDRVRVDVALYPDQRRYRVSGQLDLVNRGDRPIDRVALGLPTQNRRDGTLELDGATLRRWDSRFDIGEYEFATPLAPGARTRLHFNLDVHKSGFAPLNPENYIVADAAYIELDKWIPTVGYTGRYEIGDARTRADLDLPQRQASEAIPAIESRGIALELTVSTPQHHVPVGTGALVEERLENGRRMRRFRTIEPVRNRYAVASAPYRIEVDEDDRVTIEQYLLGSPHPNQSEALAGARASLAFHSDAISEYPDDRLRLITLPSFSDAFGGTAYPGTVFLVDNRALRARIQSEPPVNPAFSIAAHEVAHQWWGRQLQPAAAPGYRFLTESLAKWSELEIIRRTHGEAVADDHRARMRGAYFRVRQTPEPALIEVQDDPATFYFKGAHALHVIGERLGRDRLRAILRQFVGDFAAPGTARAAELARRLHAGATNPADADEVRELLEQVVTHDVSLISATLKSADGEFTVQGEVRHEATRHDAAGAESPYQAHRLVELAALDDQGQVKARREIRLRGERTSFDWTLSTRPTAIVLDPRGLLLEPDESDNRIVFNP